METFHGLQQSLLELDWWRLAWAAARIALILALVKLGLKLAETSLDRLCRCLVDSETTERKTMEAAQRIGTLIKLMGQALTVLVWSVALVATLDTVGIDIRPILAGAGVIGLAVGFGAQNLVRDVVSGLFMILENQLAVGDIIRINGVGGVVEQVNLRTTVLRDLEGTVHIFPNGGIAQLSNLTRGWSAAVFDIGVAYHEDVGRVVAAMSEVARELRQDPEYDDRILEDMEIFGLDRFDSSAVVVKGRIKTLPLQQWNVARAYNLRLKSKFDELGIEIPFPHRTLVFKPDPAGGRGPARKACGQQSA